VSAASTLLEEFDRAAVAPPCVVIAAFTPARAASTLDDEFEIELELALIAASAASTLEDELERLRLEVWAVVIAAFVTPRATSVAEDEFERVSDEVCAVVIAAFNVPRAASVLDDELEIEFELAFIAASATSMLVDDVER
jgi:hypothetical protein